MLLQMNVIITVRKWCVYFHLYDSLVPTDFMFWIFHFPEIPLLSPFCKTQLKFQIPLMNLAYFLILPPFTCFLFYFNTYFIINALKWIVLFFSSLYHYIYKYVTWINRCNFSLYTNSCTYTLSPQPKPSRSSWIGLYLIVHFLPSKWPEECLWHNGCLIMMVIMIASVYYHVLGIVCAKCVTSIILLIITIILCNSY